MNAPKVHPNVAYLCPVQSCLFSTYPRPHHNHCLCLALLLCPRILPHLCINPINTCRALPSSCPSSKQPSSLKQAILLCLCHACRANREEAINYWSINYPSFVGGYPWLFYRSSIGHRYDWSIGRSIGYPSFIGLLINPSPVVRLPMYLPFVAPMDLSIKKGSYWV